MALSVQSGGRPNLYAPFYHLPNGHLSFFIRALAPRIQPHKSHLLMAIPFSNAHIHRKYSYDENTSWYQPYHLAFPYQT